MARHAVTVMRPTAFQIAIWILISVSMIEMILTGQPTSIFLSTFILVMAFTHLVCWM